MTTASWVIAGVIALIVMVVVVRFLGSLVLRLLGIGIGLMSSLVMRHYIAQIPALYSRLRHGSS